jgi:hypothetical protein
MLRNNYSWVVCLVMHEQTKWNLLWLSVVVEAFRGLFQTPPHFNVWLVLLSNRSKRLALPHLHLHIHSPNILSSVTSDIITISGSTVLVRTLAASHRRFRNLTKILGRTPLDGLPARRKSLYLHRTIRHRNIKTCLERNLNPRSQ